MIQLIILIGGALTIYLISRTSLYAKIIGFAVGFLIEPFWLYDAWVDGNWGIFILCIVYTVCYAQGFRSHLNERNKISRTV